MIDLKISNHRAVSISTGQNWLVEEVFKITLSKKPPALMRLIEIPQKVSS